MSEPMMVNEEQAEAEFAAAVSHGPEMVGICPAAAHFIVIAMLADILKRLEDGALPIYQLGIANALNDRFRERWGNEMRKVVDAGWAAVKGMLNEGAQ